MKKKDMTLKILTLLLLVSLFAIVSILIFGQNTNVDIVLTSILTSYIAAYIFYVIQIYLPRKKSEKDSFSILQKSYHAMTELLNFKLGIVNSFIKIQDDKINIQSDDIVYYTEKKHKSSYVDLHIFMKETRSILRDSVESIISTPIFMNSNIKIIEVFTKLKLNTFFKTLSNLSHFKKDVLSQINVNGLQDELSELNDILFYLISIFKDIELLEYEEMSEEEKEKFLVELELSKSLLKTKDLNMNNPYKITWKKKNDS
jgi:hypothetical protein